MDFSRLPRTAFLKIFEYLELEDYFRAGRVNKTFRQIGQLAISRTKSLDLSEYRFRNLTPDQLAVLLDLCSSNLERVKLGGRRFISQLASTFSNYECPRMIDMDLGKTPIDQAVFDQLIRNSPNMESLKWSKEFKEFPAMTNNNLKKLSLKVCSDVSLQTLIDRCPNLEELDLSVGNGITVDVLDQFFGSIQHVHQISIDLGSMEAIKFEKAEMVNFYNLPLTKLSIDFHSVDTAGDDLLSKVVKSFPNLQELNIDYLMPTNQGIAKLASLKELQVLQLYLFEDAGPYDEGIGQLAHCQNLRKLDVGQSDMTGGNLVNLLRSCPQLEYVKFWDITEVDSPEEAIVILESLAGIPKRDITIRFHLRKLIIWEGEPVKASVKKLEEDEGLKITIKHY